MAITKTRSVQKIEIYPGDPARVMVSYKHTFDDSEDNELPVSNTTEKYLEKTTLVVDNSDMENPTTTTVDTDISGEDSLVQSVCNLLWSE